MLKNINNLFYIRFDADCLLFDFRGTNRIAVVYARICCLRIFCRHLPKRVFDNDGCVVADAELEEKYFLITSCPNEVGVPFCGSVPAFVLDEFIVRTQIHCHRCAAMRTNGYKPGRDFHIVLLFTHCNNSLLVVVCFVAAGNGALKKSVVALSIEQPLFVEAGLLKLMVNVRRYDEIILVLYQCVKAVMAFSPEQIRSFQKYENAAAYRNYAIKRRDSKYISAALKESRPMVEIDQRNLDADEFLLNTPSATYDLRTGISSAHDHVPEDFITKQTSVDPSDEGADIWRNALKTFFCGDGELIDYVQEIAGLSAIGKVCIEGLIIAYGEGRNGKSTFWNTLAHVLGTYSGNMSADTLTVGCKRNVKPELAEAKGKRLVIAAELEEGMRLNTSNVKQLCSTDEIYAEKKYKDPFSFIPSHTLVLYTNHLPKVGAIDAGTWRRLIVIPFNARIEGPSDIKNYAEYLYANAGGAILKWIMTGSKRVIEKGYHIAKLAVVAEATRKYKENNDWLSQFLDECCEISEGLTAKSGEIYNAYRSYCMQGGDYIRSTTDFYTALECAGFERKRSKSARLLLGLQLKSDFLD